MPRKIVEIPVDSTEDMFPFMTGFGSGTGYELKCDWCGVIHNEGLEPDETDEGDDVHFVEFGSLTVADCCFDKLEAAVLACSPEIIAWLEYRAKRHEKFAESNHEMASRGARALETTGDVEPSSE